MHHLMHPLHSFLLTTPAHTLASFIIALLQAAFTNVTAATLLQVLGVGIDEMVKRGKLDHLRDGPLYWVDTADSQPCIGTGGICAWELTAYGEDLHALAASQQCA